MLVPGGVKAEIQRYGDPAEVVPPVLPAGSGAVTAREGNMAFQCPALGKQPRASRALAPVLCYRGQLRIIMSFVNEHVSPWSTQPHIPEQTCCKRALGVREGAGCSGRVSCFY